LAQPQSSPRRPGVDRIIEIRGVREPPIVKEKRLVVHSTEMAVVVDAQGNPIHGCKDHYKLLELEKVSAALRSAKIAMLGCIEINSEDQRRS
jgi:hypothetical protein